MGVSCCRTAKAPPRGPASEALIFDGEVGPGAAEIALRMVTGSGTDETVDQPT